MWSSWYSVSARMRSIMKLVDSHTGAVKQYCGRERKELAGQTMSKAEGYFLFGLNLVVLVWKFSWILCGVWEVLNSDSHDLRSGIMPIVLVLIIPSRYDKSKSWERFRVRQREKIIGVQRDIYEGQGCYPHNPRALVGSNDRYVMRVLNQFEARKLLSKKKPLQSKKARPLN